MAYKSRSVPMELNLLRVLRKRMDFTHEQEKYYLNKVKGFEGEVQFDLLTEQLRSDCLILNDLCFEVNNTSFQLDTSIIFQDTFYFFEIKNFEGDYCYRADRFETINGKVIMNPLDQIKRSHTLLLQLLQKLGYHIAVDASVVFVNPEFFLYQAPKDKPIYYPNHLNRLMRKLNNESSKLSEWHKSLADKLISLHQVESAYSNVKIPTYDYKVLRKGNTCCICHSFSCSVCNGKVICADCGHVEGVESAVLRCVEEIKLLFPGMKVTTNGVFEWFGLAVSKKQINRILIRSFSRSGHGKYSYYVDK
ncbi:nuclease-related domain-containing protein [Neobacillus cucumis]|uniref:nuclease-related domain-containing protein n=1 Tax=Neobacillus cucumis TaxID=1740721 RepID=UPI002E1C7AA8|nr:nuclease-related domain-containing protein [Neobacillus cucumis]